MLVETLSRTQTDSIFIIVMTVETLESQLAYSAVIVIKSMRVATFKSRRNTSCIHVYYFTSINTNTC